MAAGDGTQQVTTVRTVRAPPKVPSHNRASLGHMCDAKEDVVVVRTAPPQRVVLQDGVRRKHAQKQKNFFFACLLPFFPAPTSSSRRVSAACPNVACT